MAERVQSALLSEEAGIEHGFFTRNGGVSTGAHASLNCANGTGDDPKTVALNMERVRMALGAECLFKAYQVHGTHAEIVQEKWAEGYRPEADALVTNVPGFAVGITTADCTPVLFADAEAGIVAATHAGWKGALAGIIASTISAMEKLGANRKNILAAIGPCIHQKSYEVDDGYRKKFIEKEDGNKKFFILSSRSGHHMFDLPGYVQSELERHGISAINKLDFDTCADENRFFSYRRACQRGEEQYGCQFSAIVLKE